MWVYKYLFKTLFSILKGIHTSGIVESYASSILYFVRKYHTVFHSSVTLYLSYPQCKSVPISLHLCQHLLFSVFLVVVILIGILNNLGLHFLMVSGIEYLFMCSVAICISSWRKVFSCPLPIFESGSFCCCC